MTRIFKYHIGHLFSETYFCRNFSPISYHNAYNHDNHIIFDGDVHMRLFQGRSQPHSPGWANVPLSSIFPQIFIIFSYFSSNFLIFFLILILRVGDSPSLKGSGYTIGLFPEPPVFIIKINNIVSMKYFPHICESFYCNDNNCYFWTIWRMLYDVGRSQNAGRHCFKGSQLDAFSP